MSQESFMYSFVARGTMILAEYTEFTGNFPAIVAQCLHRLPSSNNKFTCNCDHHTFNFLVEDGIIGIWGAGTATAKSLNKEFGPIMKGHMEYIIEHAEEIEKLLKVRAQVSEVKSIMLENIDKALERGENLTTLADKTENLRNQERRDKSSQEDVVSKLED
ncbi:hypothetical protein SLA2020_508990 [Shorea laevis]